MSLTTDTGPQLEGAAAITRSPAPRRSVFPPGATNFNWFGLFNSLSWQVSLGAPVVLYAKSQGANAIVLGVIAALTPLLGVFQIPAAHLLPKYGYRGFMLAGWGSRAVFIFALAGVPLLTYVVPQAYTLRVAMVLVCLFVFNLIRGITAGAWMPWLTELIPGHLRGRFLSRNVAFAQAGALAALIISAAVLQSSPRPWQFALAFFLSAISATASLLFLRAVPQATAPEQIKRSGHRVPWAAMLAYPPFFRLLVFNVIIQIATAGFGVFTVDYLKGMAGLGDGTILLLATLSVTAGLVTVPMAGHLLDRHGSKPVLYFCAAALTVIPLGWWCVASHAVGGGLIFIALLNLAIGVAGGNLQVAISRLVMATVPEMGRNHFFALFTAIVNLSAGGAPIAWGWLLKGLGDYQLGSRILWNRYSIYFAAVALLAAAATATVGWLKETSRAATQTELMPAQVLRQVP